MKYATPIEALTAHVEKCETCKANVFGLCSLGHRLIGDIARLREQNNGQLELLPVELSTKPFVRMHERQVAIEYAKYLKQK